MFLNINSTWSEYDVLMCTPTISSGVSYTKTQHFDMVYGFASQHSCDPYVFCQMLGRVRNPTTNIMKLWVDMKENSTIRYVCNELDVKTELETNLKQMIAKNEIAHLLKFKEEDGQLKRVIDISGDHWK